MAQKTEIQIPTEIELTSQFQTLFKMSPVLIRSKVENVLEFLKVFHFCDGENDFETSKRMTRS